jgi:hypothetical protein
MFSMGSNVKILHNVRNHTILLQLRLDNPIPPHDHLIKKEIKLDNTHLPQDSMVSTQPNIRLLCNR